MGGDLLLDLPISSSLALISEHVVSVRHRLLHLVLEELDEKGRGEVDGEDLGGWVNRKNE